MIRERVITARKVQENRYTKRKETHCNAQIDSRLLKQVCLINEAATTLLKTAMAKLNSRQELMTEF